MKQCLLLVLAVFGFFNSQAQKDDERKIAMGLIQTHAKQLGLTDNDIRETVISSTYLRPADGIRMVYCQQSYLGIPVFNKMQVLAFRNNQLVSVSGGRVAHLEQIIDPSLTRPLINPSDAVRTAMTEAKVAVMNIPSPLQRADGKLDFGKMGVALYDVVAEQVWLPLDDKQVRLTWQVEIAPADSRDHWLIRVDAATNRVLDKNNYTVFENFDQLARSAETALAESGNQQALQGHSSAGNGADQDESPLVVNNASYKVIPFPAESPIHTGGTQTLVNNPWTLTGGNATSLGWHFDGTIYHDSTRGNNVWAQEDRDNNNTTNGKAALSTTAQPNLSLDYTYDFAQAPTVTANQQMAITNLFYWNNLVHDITYLYGFDEPSGNFQNSNQGRGGAGNDYVKADAQDAGGTNNANFSTPNDGSQPRMQMYLWTTVTPNRDGDLDNGIIIHEYTHGISNRLTGGPSNSSCLGNAEQGGEGWSDYFALMYTTDWTTAQVTDGFNKPRGIGTYALNQATSGLGIRTYKYCTNMSVNPWTYAMMATNTGGAVHTIGEIWCTALWEMTWEIIAQDGINPNIFNPSGTGGNTAALKLVVEGMRLQPCSPGFIDARNAILKADTIFYGGKYSCAIWNAFAKRGMGVFASQGSSTSYTDQVANFVSTGTAQLSLTQSVRAQEEGLQVTYTNRVTAGTCGGINNYLLTDTLPASVTYVSGGTYNSANRVVSFQVTLGAGQSQDYSFTVQVNNGTYFPADTLLNEKLTGTAGTIPAGWAATSTTTSVWTTHNTRSFSAPNSFFTPNRTTASDQILSTTGSYSLGAIPLELSFWHWINSEGSWDGGVVEISTNGGTTWTDLGSSITQNGYTGTLGSGSALAGRSAFTGNSGSFINTKVNLTNFANQNAQFRFRFASDGSVAVTGWNIDDILLSRTAKYTIKSNLFNAVGTVVNSVDTFTLILPGNPCGAGSTVSFSNQPVPAAVCEGTTANFSVTASGPDPVYQWQVSTDGGNSYNNINGETNATLSLTNTLVSMSNNRYRCQISNGCTIPAINSDAVILTVYALPSAPSGTGSAICGSGASSISATAGPGETIDWYALASGGNALQSGSGTFNIPQLNATTIYYAEARNTTTGCVSATRTAVTATVHDVPSPPTPSGGIAVCGSGSVTLTAIPGQGQTIDWYSSASGGNALVSGSPSFTTPVIFNPTTYYAEARDLVTSCVSSVRTPVTAVVNKVPAAPSVIGASRCGTGSVILNASAFAGETIDWYVVPSGGLAVSTNASSYNTGTLSATTVYYAETRNISSGCTSATRTPVTATILSLSFSTTSVTICSSEAPYNWNGQNYSSEGTYNVTLTNSVGCDSIATLNLQVIQNPQAFTVTGGGSYTNGGQGVPVGLSSSQTGVSYQLFLNGSNPVGNPVPGTGNPLDFGNQTAEGSYTVSASFGNCQSSMSNSVSVTIVQSTTPTAFTVTGGGTYCQGTSGIEIGLSGSETGVRYQLKRNGGTINVGSPVAGTGGPISFGIQALAADYTVSATNLVSLITVPMLNTVWVRIAQLRAPGSPGAITGPADVCGLTNGSIVRYYINQVRNATSYIWTAPAGATIIGSNTDTAVDIQYPSTFVSGVLSVKSVNACFNNSVSTARNLAIIKNVAAIPGTITASLVNLCTVVGTQNTVTYTIRKVNYASGYNWILSPGINLVSSYGDTGVVVRFDQSFVSGTIGVQAYNVCSVSATRSLSVVAVKPAVPGVISGLTNVCSLVGQNTTTTYSIAPVADAVSYNWIVPANITIVSGQGTTSLEVSYPTGFTSGTISVQSVALCGNSASRSLSVSASVPIKPGLISGVTQVCAYVGQQVTVTYTIDPIAGAQSYTWVTPANTSIVSGQGTTSIELLYSQAFVSGNIGVRSNASCGSSSYRTLSVTKQVTRPGPITASSSPCPNSTVTYTIAPVPNATTYSWTLPMNAVYVSGQGSTSYTVTFKPEFTTGTVGVKSLNNCSSSLSTTLALDAASCAPAQFSGTDQISQHNAGSLAVLNVFPNPSRGQFIATIRSDYMAPAKIQLLDMYGRVVFEQTEPIGKTGTFQSVIRAEKLPAGIYELKCTSGGRVSGARVIISK